MTSQVRAISYGGGVQSTAMLVLATQGRIDYKVALFSNVGDDSEHPATLRYVREVAVPFCAEHDIELVILDRTGRGKPTTLWENLHQEGSKSINIPVRMSGSGAPGRRNCTGQFKIRRIASEVKRRGATVENPAVVALGISLDEFKRMRTDSGIAWEKLDYPLIDLRLDRADCVKVITDAGLPEPPKSSCFFCPFHTRAHWLQMKREEPELFAKSVALERVLNERRASLGRDPVWLTSALRPLDEVVGDHDQLDLFPATCDIGGYCMA
jgi:hypothetical protein